MKTEEIAAYITNWLKNYSDHSNTNGFVVGISGGIDSAVTSTLAAKTLKPVWVLNLPIHQRSDEYNRANEHIEWLKNNFKNVTALEINLTESFEALKSAFPEHTSAHRLSMANTRSRLRMTTLYAIAQSNNLLVAGTGNKVEDFGIGFFTKYGDGGVDLSPIADLYKTQVYELGKHLGIVASILNAVPTDGLWEDGRSDEQQIGATYSELEWAMQYMQNNHKQQLQPDEINSLTDINSRQKQVLKIYLTFHNANRHKMVPVPVCKIPAEWLL
jgi:NAD+ synthase